MDEVLDKFCLSLNMDFIYLHPQSENKPTTHDSSAKRLSNVRYVKFLEILRECLRLNTKVDIRENIAKCISMGQC